MDGDSRFHRSGELMSVGDTALLIVDMQEKLLGAIAQRNRVEWNCRRLLDGAKVLGVPALATEQYPERLGPTIEPLAGQIPDRPAKLRFSCAECLANLADLERQGIFKMLLCGIEAHVCVQQTALDLLARGWRVYVAVDAVGSRFDLDLQIALRRMESAGATLTTTEAALFEWCEAAGTPEFKQISLLVREPAPE